MFDTMPVMNSILTVAIFHSHINMVTLHSIHILYPITLPTYVFI